MSHDCATVNQYHNAILQFNGVLSLFTTGSNTTALPDRVATAVIIGVGTGGGIGVLTLTIAVCALILLVIRFRRGWCMCMFCTCNCRSYYFEIGASWIHAQASLVTAGNLKVNVTAT